MDDIKDSIRSVNGVEFGDAFRVDLYHGFVQSDGANVNDKMGSFRTVNGGEFLINWVRHSEDLVGSAWRQVALIA